MLKPKVRHLRTLNMVGGWSMRYQLLWPAIKVLWSWVGLSWVIARGRAHGGIVAYHVGCTGDGHTTCIRRAVKLLSVTVCAFKLTNMSSTREKQFSLSLISTKRRLCRQATRPGRRARVTYCLSTGTIGVCEILFVIGYLYIQLYSSRVIAE